MDDVTAKNILLKLNEWRKAGITSDVILIIGEQEFHAHKSILAAAVEFFEKLFLCDFAEKGKNTITLKDVDPNGFRLILDYIYTKEIQINDDNFEQVLSVAVYYQIECLIERLFNWVKDNVSTNNGFHYYCSADSVGVERMKQFLKEFIRKDFLSCSDSAAFLDITHPIFLDFMDSPITDELNRFKVIMKWIQYDSNKRSDYLSDLLKHVRFSYISNDAIVHDILDYQLVINNLEIIKTIKERKDTERTMWIYGMDGSDLIRVGIVKAKVEAIHVMVKTEVDYDEFQIVSSADAVYVSTFKKYEGNTLYRFKGSQWTLITNNSILGLANRSILYSEKHKAIYTINENDVYCHNLDADDPEYDDYEHDYELCGSLVSYNDLIYTTALCSSDLYCILRYDPYIDNFHFISRLLKRCPDAVNAVLEDKMFIISGGVVQMYDITKNECKIIVVNEENSISYHSLIGYQNRLYAIRKTWDAIDVFDPLENDWTEEIDLKMNNVRIFNMTRVIQQNTKI